MSAPKNNRNSVGHGRPHKVGFSDIELIQLGEDLINWLKKTDLENTVVVHLSEFYSEIKGIDPIYWKDSICRRACFSAYYERAMLWMGKKLLKNRKLPPTYGSRFLGVYFKEIAEHELEQAKKKIDYELDKKAELISKSTVSPNDSSLNQLIADVKSLKGIDINAVKSQADSELQ